MTPWDGASSQMRASDPRRVEHLDTADDLIFIGYEHGGIIGCLRPDVAYPDRKIRAGTKVHTTILAKPCPCNDEKGHVEVWVRRIPRRKLWRRSQNSG